MVGAARLSVCLAFLVVGVAACGSGGGARSTSTPTASGAQAAPGGAGATGDLQRRMIDVIDERSASVVQIEAEGSLGSGVVYDDAGNIVTNNHVVATARSFTVTLAKGDRHRATLVGTFPAGDLAVIKLQSGSPAPAPFADSSKAAVGEFVLAIGNPLGLRSSVTDGIISSLGRTVNAGNGVVIPSAVQTSAAINPGNSGGALVDLDGKVVGIPTLAATVPELGGGQAAGIGFAIPSNTVKRIAKQLIATGRVTSSGRAYLGVEVATTLQGSGVAVAAVTTGGPADEAGIRRGDVIVAVDGKPTPTTEELATILAGLRPGTTVPVTIRRQDGSQTDVRVKLSENPG